MAIREPDESQIDTLAEVVTPRQYVIDPPSGWLYGFPRIFDFVPSHPNLPGEEHQQEVHQWFRDHGYPQELISQGMLNHCRSWFVYDSN